jgi:hypothetical protein
MNVEIRAEAALFPEKEYIYGIFVTVCMTIAVHFFGLCLHECSCTCSVQDIYLTWHVLVLRLTSTRRKLCLSHA